MLVVSRQPASEAADQPGPVGVPEVLGRVPLLAADRGCSTEPGHLGPAAAAGRSTPTAAVALHARDVADGSGPDGAKEPAY